MNVFSHIYIKHPHIWLLLFNALIMLECVDALRVY